MLAQSKKSRKVDAMTLILQKIQNPVRFKPFYLISTKFKNQTTDIWSTITKNYFV